MIERLVENWLANATERSFQTLVLPHANKQGHDGTPSDRHGEMEIGKDVIAVDREGTPFAYQLKTPSGPRITMSGVAKGNCRPSTRSRNNCRSPSVLIQNKATPVIPRHE